MMVTKTCSVTFSSKIFLEEFKFIWCSNKINYNDKELIVLLNISGKQLLILNTD